MEQRTRPSVYVITDYTKRKAKEMGLTVAPSSKGFKKIDVFKNGVPIASIGDKRYLDYPNYIRLKGLVYANERRRLYHLRHTSVGLGETLAKKLLW
jgi:hypothetical protein